MSTTRLQERKLSFRPALWKSLDHWDNQWRNLRTSFQIFCWFLKMWKSTTECRQRINLIFFAQKTHSKWLTITHTQIYTMKLQTNLFRQPAPSAPAGVGIAWLQREKCGFLVETYAGILWGSCAATNCSLNASRAPKASPPISLFEVEFITLNLKTLFHNAISKLLHTHPNCIPIFLNP